MSLVFRQKDIKYVLHWFILLTWYWEMLYNGMSILFVQEREKLWIEPGKKENIVDKGAKMEKILLFHVEDIQAVKGIAGPMHIKVENVLPEYYKETIDCIYRGKTGQAPAYTGEIPKEGLMVFCKVAPEKLDKILKAIRKKKLSIDYKAIMTPTNEKWNVLRLYMEMEREKRAYQQG